MINNVCAKFPHCHIPIDAEYKARIAKLKTKLPGMPPAENETWAQELKGYVGIVQARIEEAHKLLNDVGEAWMNMEDINDLVKIRE